MRHAPQMNPAQKRVGAQLDAMLDKAHGLIMALIESEARRILRARNPAQSFCMGMGTATFYDREGRVMDDDHPALNSFYAFVYEYNSAFRFTGAPLKIDSADAPALTDW